MMSIENATSAVFTVNSTEPRSNSWLAVCFLISSIPGVFLNTLILIYCFYPILINSQIKYFLGNFALINVMYGITSMIQIRFVLSPYIESDVICAVVGTLAAYAGIAAKITTPLVSLDQFIQLCHPQFYQHRFTAKTCKFVCFATHVYVAQIVCLLWMWGNGAGLDGPVCRPIDDPLLARLQLVAAPALAYVLTIFCCIRIGQKLTSAHVTNMTPERRKQAKILLILSVIYLLVPLVLLVPFLINRVIEFKLGVSGLKGIDFALNSCAPLFYAVFTVLLIKSFRVNTYMLCCVVLCKHLEKLKNASNRVEVLNLRDEKQQN